MLNLLGAKYATGTYSEMERQKGSSSMAGRLRVSHVVLILAIVPPYTDVVIVEKLISGENIRKKPLSGALIV
jgi:hypothetical protein